MKVLPEFFDPSQYVQPDMDSHFTIKRPYTTFSKSMSLQFEEYSANLKVQCIVFDRIWHTCQNIYGVKEAKRKHRCFEALNYFDQCLKVNSFMANQKKYFDHQFGTSKYYNLTPTHEQLNVD